MTKKHGIIKQWEVLTEATGVAEARLAGAILVEKVSIEVEIVAETGQCSKLLAATVEKSAKYLLGPQTANRFIAATVLRKWVGESLIPQDRKGLILEHQA